MSTIRAMCPHCISPVDLDPAEILLAPAPPSAFEVHTNAGVRVEESLSPHRFTVDDLIEFHQLLNTPDWFAQLQP